MKKKVITIIAILLAIYGFGQVIKAQEQFTCDKSVVTVVKDDTVWKIAEQHCTGDISSAVHAIINISGVEIRPGQIIQLP